MTDQPHHITHAYWLAPRLGCVLLDRDWNGKKPPSLAPVSSGLAIGEVRPAPPDFIGRFCGYYQRDPDTVVFCQEATRHPQIDFEHTPIRVVGPFNEWGRGENVTPWRLEPREDPDGGVLWECSVPAGDLGDEPFPFRFVSSGWHWLRPLACAPNLLPDEAGNVNYLCEPHKSSRHVFFFDVANGRGLDGNHSLTCEDGGKDPGVPVRPGLSFYDLATEKALGATIEDGRTVFRLFAPRATAVRLERVKAPDAKRGERHTMSLDSAELTWEVALPGNLHGAYYYYLVEGEDDGVTTAFDPDRRLLDPWALAAAGPFGPGIVLDRSKLPRREEGPPFEPPRHHDLVILEAHLRDLTRYAPIALTDAERPGFSGLRKWLETDGNYVERLGVNALELQPVTQFDSPERGDYHWGYMPTNFFAPCSHYGARPEHASQVDELRELVAACHRKGLAVIFDVVYNHVGEPPFLSFIDKSYYFHTEEDGELINWSGCGNTLRAESAMSRRLIIESLTHLVETFDVDGFRFDLGELLTTEVLREIEIDMKAVKPSLVLIAEPWSFRGHIAWELRTTSFSFWNDQYRDFVPAYLCGEGDACGLAYFMKGCLDHLSAWPAQSINYTESHDDRCWLDQVTENAECDGTDPTANDLHRTHLMAAILFCSIGTPMLAAGQDFLRSKGGRRNTYLEGDVNALDYSRLDRFGRSHFYFRQWITFRKSPWGEILRLSDTPTADYVRVFTAGDRSAAALVFNADRSRGHRRILFAVNPHFEPVILPLHDLDTNEWMELADRENFNFHGVFNGRLDETENHITLGPVDCGLWIKE